MCNAQLNITAAVELIFKFIRRESVVANVSASLLRMGQSLHTTRVRARACSCGSRCGVRRARRDLYFTLVHAVRIFDSDMHMHEAPEQLDFSCQCDRSNIFIVFFFFVANHSGVRILIVRDYGGRDRQVFVRIASQ